MLTGLFVHFRHFDLDINLYEFMKKTYARIDAAHRFRSDDGFPWFTPRR